MVNENKVRDIVERSKKTFLKGELVNVDDKTIVYNLGDEFAKTKKNKNLRVYIYSSIFIIALIVVALLITAYIQYQGRSLTVNIGDFEDVKLTELLDTVKKNENKMDNIKRQQSDLKIQMQNEIQAIHDKYSQKKQELYKQNYSSKKQAQLLNGLKVSEDQEINAVQMKYRNQLSTKQAELNQAQSDIDKYDKKLQQTMDKAEEMVNNFKRLHILKMDELRKELTLKYNPFFESVQLQKILAIKNDLEKNKTLFLQKYDPDLGDKKILYQTDFNSLRENINNYFLLLNRMQEIPYENSVAPTLKQMDYLSKAIINNYESLWSKLNKRSLMLNSYQYALNYLAKDQTENGYIIDAHDTKNINVFINSIVKIKNGTIGLVFRTEDNYIGKIKLNWQGQDLKAEVVELQNDKQLLPFDKILLQLEGTANNQPASTPNQESTNK